MATMQTVTLALGETVTVQVGLWTDEDGAFRAAYTTDGQGSLLLTDRSQMHLADDALLAAGVAQALAI